MNTETIQLSISKNYVCNWKLWEAVREILQNAQDADTEGYKLSISYNPNDSELLISNEGPRCLSPSSLVLGNSVKSEECIGKYGEGYKLALVVLLRLGFDVRILNGKDLWIPKFEYSDVYGSEVLQIEIRKNALDHDGITFVISGLTSSHLDELKTNSLVLARQLGVDTGRTIVSDYGEVLMNERYSGMFYVEGLFIQKDSNFKYGYSFNSDVVDLDRDRRAINYYDLLGLTTDTLISQKDDFKIVEQCLTQKCKDVEELDNFYHKATDEFAKGYAQHFMEQHNIDEDTFVGTEKEVLVSNVPKTFVTDAVQASIVNQGLDKLDSYNYVKELAAKKDNQMVAYKYYNDSLLKKLHTWLIDNAKYLSNKRINEFLDICEESKPSSYSLIKDSVLDNLYQQLNKMNNAFKRQKKESDK